MNTNIKVKEKTLKITNNNNATFYTLNILFVFLQNKTYLYFFYRFILIIMQSVKLNSFLKAKKKVYLKIDNKKIVLPNQW